MNKYLRENWIAFIVPVILLCRMLFEIIFRIATNYSIDRGEILDYILLSFESFIVVSIFIAMYRSKNVLGNVIVGFIYSCAIVYYVDVLTLSPASCLVYTKNLVGGDYSGLAVILSAGELCVLSLPLLIPIISIISNKESKNKLAGILILNIPMLVGLGYFIFLVFSWGRYSLFC